MGGLATWMCILIAMTVAAWLWFTYLVKIVLNDEVVQERKRRRQRARELERRRLQDRYNARNKGR
ncbi:MAG: hypothetical protein LIP77_09910 [Planctomycetes bacterium]|nr:hypothetical protein [Planctomycetota bacterium]